MKFALVDCNNFYCSCERVFNPSLIGVPIVALSNNDGCVISRSEEAKKLGIEMGAPAFKIEPLFRKNGVRVFSSNYTLYGDMSARVMSILSNAAPAVEIYSIDEAFLNLPTEMEEGFAKQLKKKVFQWTGIPVCVGVGPTKTLAKVANRFAKKNGFTGGTFDISGNVDPILREMQSADIWGIGKRLAARLRTGNVITALDLKNADPAWVRRELGVVGERVTRELNGLSCLALEEMPAQKKGVACARSFGENIEDLGGLEEALATYAARVAEKIRAQGLAAGAVHVFLETNPFKPEQPQYCRGIQTTLFNPSNLTPVLIETALQLLRKIYRVGYRYKKVGIMLTDLCNEDCVQLSLISEFSPSPSAQRLAVVVDGINRVHGTNTVFFGSMGTAKAWKMRQEKKSPCFTTRWSELPIAQAK